MTIDTDTFYHKIGRNYSLSSNILDVRNIYKILDIKLLGYMLHFEVQSLLEDKKGLIPADSFSNYVEVADEYIEQAKLKTTDYPEWYKQYKPDKE